MNYDDYVISLCEKTSLYNPLKISLEHGTMYFKEFRECIALLEKYLSDSEMKKLLENKLQLGRNDFIEDAYYQEATELTVILSALDMCNGTANEFRYEKPAKTGTKKNPECTVSFEDGVVFNFEAKCPSHDKLIAGTGKEKDILYSAFGRAASKKDADDVCSELKKIIQESSADVGFIAKKHDDNKLKDFLYSAGEKFPDDKCEKVLNILFVALNDKLEMSCYFGYLFGSGELFTPNCFADREKFCNVDCVMLTNSYFRHKNNENINGSAWRLNDGFNLLFSNPGLSTQKYALIWFLQAKIIDYAPQMMHLVNFSRDLSDLDYDIKKNLAVPYIVKELEEGKYLFEKKVQEEARK